MKSRFLVASVLTVFAAVAAAENDAVGPLLLDPLLANQSVEFNIPIKDFAGGFTDVFTFEFFPTVPCCSDAAATSVHVQLSGTPDISFNGVLLNGVAGTFSNSGLVSSFLVGPVAFDPANNPAYVLSVSGVAAAGGTYGGSLNVAVVPEPETYLMMLAGLTAVGFVAARRRRRRN